MSEIKIAHIVPTLDLLRGGPGRSVSSMVLAQFNNGAKVRLVYGNNPGSIFQKVDSVEQYSADLLRMRFSIPSFQLSKKISECIHWADIVHLHSIWNGVIYEAGVISRRLNKCAILSPRGMLDSHNLKRRRFLKSAWLRLAESRNLVAMRGFHFQDESERCGCQWLECTQTRPCIIQSNGADVPKRICYETYHPDGDSVRASLFGKSGGVNLVFLGRLSAIKGIDLQLYLVRDLKQAGFDITLHLVGPDEDSGRELQNIVLQLGIRDNVRFVGPVYGDERFLWLREADAVLLTSHYECNSNTAMETIAVGGVLVATDTCHLDKPAESGAIRLVARDRNAMLKAIIDIIQSPLETQKLRDRAKYYSAQHLDWDGLAVEMLRFYESILR